MPEVQREFCSAILQGNARRVSVFVRQLIRHLPGAPRFLAQLKLPLVRQCLREIDSRVSPARLSPTDGPAMNSQFARSVPSCLLRFCIMLRLLFQSRYAD